MIGGGMRAKSGHWGRKDRVLRGLMIIEKE